MNTELRNCVIIFEQFSKDWLKYDDLRELIQGEKAQVLDTPIAQAPVTFSYPRALLEVSFVGPTLQVQTTTIETARAAREFPRIVVDVLNSFKDNSHPNITAFGFNFNYTVKDSPNKVHEIIKLPSFPAADKGFAFTPETFIRVAFNKGSAKFYSLIQDSGNNVMISVNVHHEGPIQVDELKSQLPLHYSEAYENSLQLLEEVFKL